MLTRSGLVIEDEAVVAPFLSDILTGLNCEVCAVAATGLDAPAARHRPAPAMVDMRLQGDLGGLDTAGAPHTQFDIPSTLLSANPGVLRSAEKRGVTPIAVRTKPYTPEQLETVLAGAFAPSR